MAYKSPIEIAHELSNNIMQVAEKEVLNAVYKVGVKVDKEELIKAMVYDREQYKAGYEDGFAEGIAVRPSPKDFISMRWLDDWIWENSDVCCDSHVSRLFGKMIKDWREENEQREDT